MDSVLALYNQPRLIADGDTLILVSGWFRVTAWAISCAALALLSWGLFRGGHARRPAWVALGVSLAVAVVVIPGIARERITVSPDQLAIQTGLWFAPVVIDYRLAEFVAAHEVEPPTNWYRTDHFLILEARAGPDRRYRMSDFFSANRELIFERLSAAGLEID